MKRITSFIFALAFAGVHAQNSNTIFTSDIDNFWNAYDQIKKTDDFSKKLNLINELYISKGTKGLKTFMEVREYSDTVFVRVIDGYPKFWNSIRPNTLKVKEKISELNKSVTKLKEIYPQLKDAEMYFTVGGLNSGGTVSKNMVLVGTEIATGTPNTDVSEFKNGWLKGVFAEQSLDNIVSLNIHEYIHTQQNGRSKRVLNHSIKEGSCDFITELVMQKPLRTKYLSYGAAHADQLKALFKNDMFSTNSTNWLYNGRKRPDAADLGYYIGYEICKSYYQNAKDKKQAIKDIIELNYNDDNAVEDFLARSKFFKEKINKEKLLKEYEKSLLYVVKTDPAVGSETVSPATKEIKITFSKEIVPDHYSIETSEKGKESFPLAKVIGLENNNITLVLGMDLQPNKTYEFVLSNKKFESKDGYPLKDEKFLITFKTAEK
ncbi:Ig-like domain-containing protein [Chryseobacterium sp. Mn2064]|uniref:gliding motility protein GldB-related protein n=1 Tax=Chryseobacterium sp. Mn2064 TaxID=3395263 RepID=UPI003BD4DFC1